MKRKNRNYKSGTSKFIPSLLFCTFSYIIFSLIASFILLKTAESSRAIPLVSLVVFLLSGAASGIFITRYKGDGGIGLSSACFVTFIFILTLLSLILSKGKVSGGVFMNYLCYLLIGVLFSFLGRKRARRHIHRHR